MSSRSHHGVLSTGTALRLRSADGRSLGEVQVVQVRDGLVWITGSALPIQGGDRVLMERRLAGDARYVAPARVEFLPPETIALRRTGDWERDQRRANVRIRVFDVVAELLAADDPDAKPVRAELIDVSAGGLAARCSAGFSPGDEVRCRFVVPPELEVDLEARVVRCSGGGAGRKLSAAFEFSATTETQRARIREWVLREGVRRRKMKNEER